MRGLAFTTTTSLAGDEGGSNNEEEAGGVEIGVEIPLALLAIAVHIIAGHLLEKRQERSKHAVVISESLIAVVCGALAGAAVRYGGKEGEVSEFRTEIFWYAVLPPIILQQAYSLRKADFFLNLMPIMVYGILGTLITFTLLTTCAYYFSRLEWVLSVGCTDGLVDFRDHGEKGGRAAGGGGGGGGEGDDGSDPAACFEDFSLIKSLLLAAILSASDGVAALKHIQPHHHQQQHGHSSSSSSSPSSSRLGPLILGENVLNEALSILLFKTAFDDYTEPTKEEIDHVTGLRALVLLTTAVLIGVLVGLACSRLFRRFTSFKEDPLRQVAILVISNYLAYGIAECLELSGTLTLLFCTMTVSHYSYRNLAPEARAGSYLTFELMAQVAEAFSFVYIGLTLSGLRGQYSARYSFLIFLAVIGARLVSVLVLSPLVRMWDRRLALPLKEQMAFAVAGMMRGNVSWAQALQVRAMDHEIASTVLVVVLLGMLVFEIVLPLLVRVLGVGHGGGGGGGGGGHGKKGKGEEEEKGKRRRRKEEYKGVLMTGESEEEEGGGGGDEILLVHDWNVEEETDEQQRQGSGAGADGGAGPSSSPSSLAVRWNRWVFDAFHRFDQRYMQPFFSGPPVVGGAGSDDDDEEEEDTKRRTRTRSSSEDSYDGSSIGSSRSRSSGSGSGSGSVNSLIRHQHPYHSKIVYTSKRRRRRHHRPRPTSLLSEDGSWLHNSQIAPDVAEEEEEEEEEGGGASVSSLSLPFHHDQEETASEGTT